MPRKLRVEYEDALYHVMCRGDRREAIFRDQEDRHLFLRTLGEVCGRTGWRVHAYVLMTNHYHLLLETPQANLVRGMQWFQTTYTVRHNRRHGLNGHVFQGRYKAVLVEPGVSGYFAALSDYIHLNPARARLVAPNARLADYLWSSLPGYALPPRKRPVWLRTTEVMGELGLTDKAADRDRYARRMEERARESLDEQLGKELRRGWCLGSEEFKERLLGKVESLMSGIKGGRLRVAHVDNDYAARWALRLFEAGLTVFQLRPEDLPDLRKSDWRKRVIGWTIRRETTVPLAWLGERLQMGTVSRVSRLCGDIADLDASARAEAGKILKIARSKA